MRVALLVGTALGPSVAATQLSAAENSASPTSSGGAEGEGELRPQRAGSAPAPLGGAAAQLFLIWWGKP